MAAVKYEPTISLGSIISILTIAIPCFIGWNNLTNDVARLNGEVAQVKRDNDRQDAEWRDSRAEFGTQIRELRLDIKELLLQGREGAKR